ncbi:MAG TPA: hypothetical protein EYG21_02485 [Nitrospinaceae bacterium]|nr:hypothetical protein [Nitrospinaceae bacterium]
MKYKFQKGDLVKNKKSITWRNQEAMGVIIEDVGMFSGRQLVRIKWIKSNSPKETKNLRKHYYAKSLELVASVSK